MNDLSDSSDSDNTAAPAPAQLTSSTPARAREIEPGLTAPQEGLHDATGQEVTLSPEVSAAGVKVHPATISIPPPVAHMGVRPSGQNVPVATTTSIKLPLTDDQIAVGLQQSLSNSLRWLAAWCVRRLKQFHIALKIVHGKLIRVKSNN